MAFAIPLVAEIPLEGALLKALTALGVVVGSLIVAKILDFFVERFLKKRVAATHSDIDDKLLGILHRPLYYVIILIGLLVGLRLVISPAYLGLADTTIHILLIVIVTKVLFSSVDLIFHDIARKLTARTKSTIDDEALPFLSKLAKAIILLTSFMLILGKLGFTEAVVTSIAGLGIAGFAIGFAAKDTIANMLSGFFILTDRPFKRGDRIELGQYVGEVVDIGLRTTKILTLDKNYVIIPNSKISATELVNYTLPNARIKLKIPIGVAYGSDIEKVKKIVLETAKKCPDMLDDPQPAVYLTEFAESSINLLLIVWVGNFRQRFTVTDFLLSRLYDQFAQQDIEIPFPCRTVYLRKDS